MDENKENFDENNENFNEGLDPMYPAEQAVIPSISDRLSENEVKDNDTGENVHAETALPFDISKMSKEQLQVLKSMLAATPEGGKKPKQKPQIKIRTIDGKVMEDFKNAYLALVRDSVNNRDIERHKIPVKFFGHKDYEDILYKTFMEAEFTTFEILSTRRELEEVVEGETISRETGTLVDLVIKKVKDFFTIKLPNGETVEVPAKIANA